MPARLLIDNYKADLAGAERVATFIRDRPVSFVLGRAHRNGQRRQGVSVAAQYHPHEHVLQMTKDDLLALPRAIRSFNAFYTQSGKFVFINSMHTLIAFRMVAALVLNRVHADRGSVYMASQERA